MPKEEIEEVEPPKPAKAAPKVPKVRIKKKFKAIAQWVCHVLEEYQKKHTVFP